MTNQLIKASELADIIGVKPDTVYKLARKGKIPSIKVGGSLRFDKNDFKTEQKDCNSK